MGEERLIREIKGYALKNAVDHGGKAVPGPVISKLLGSHPELRSKAKEVALLVRKIVDEVNSLPRDEQEKLLEEEFPHLLQQKRKEERKGLPPLPNAEKLGEVKTRFAPNPDFFIHLGNARPAILSYEYAKMYEGTMVLRFEDTDPKTKPPLPEAYRKIKEDLKWLGVKWDEEYIQSLRMNIYYDVAKKVIEAGGAYVDLCSQTEFRKYKLSGKPCPHREQGIDENLELFDKMISGHFGEGEAVLRIKTDLTLSDPSVIDWVAFRIIDTDKHPHPIVGSKYVAWPTYNFAAGVDDHLMGITHILRGKEHSINTVKQSYLYSHLGWSYPEVINLGRLHLEGLVLSKSLIKKLLKENPNKFEGPEDVRFGTIASLRNRGIEAEMIRQLILEVGVKPSDAKISWDNIAAANRKLIDPKTPRLMAVMRPVTLTVKGYEGPKSVVIPKHPTNSALGSRSIDIHVVDGEARFLVEMRDVEMGIKRGGLRLMELCNVEVERVSGGLVEARYVGNDLQLARDKGYPIVQWVPEGGGVRLRVSVPEGLELRVEEGYGEKHLRELQPGSKVQLVRYGFVVLREVGSVVEATFMHR
ncbi:MAG: glutamate--tRNA ligase [Desulfurococcales archaeon]|nr:glutamate--tRNA ligase [Desulfurococcales archaeon]